MNIIDAKGKACPMPVVMAKKEMETGTAEFGITVDNAIAVENLKKLAASQGFTPTVTEADGVFTVTMLRTGAPAAEAPEIISCGAPTNGSWVVFAGKDVIGAGAEELGHSLIKMFFYTLAEGSKLPDAIVFMNSGVRLVTENEQTVEQLKRLEERGVRLVVCGTCLNYYSLTEKLQCGTVSNMYDIVETMTAAAKVITL